MGEKGGGKTTGVAAGTAGVIVTGVAPRASGAPSVMTKPASDIGALGLVDGDGVLPSDGVGFSAALVTWAAAGRAADPAKITEANSVFMSASTGSDCLDAKQTWRLDESSKLPQAACTTTRPVLFTGRVRCN